MTREEIILSHVRRNGLGLEIGAGCSPIAPKKHGFSVHVLPPGRRLELPQEVDREQSLS
jgi:hypothetical protein